MKKAASVFLRTEISRKDVDLMICWMENPNITKFLNEDPHITEALRRVSETVFDPMLGYFFNRSGRFFIVCLENNEAIGFVNLKKNRRV